MAERRGFFGIPVEEGDDLPVIVKNTDGSINEEETTRINQNNKLFLQASENEAFTIGKFANRLIAVVDKLFGKGEAARVIRSARDVRDIRKGQFDEEGVPPGLLQIFGEEKIQNRRKGGRIKSTVRKPREFAHGGAYRGKAHAYAAGGRVTDTSKPKGRKK